MNATASISIRTAHRDDYTALWHVAALDDSTLPDGRLLLAELDGEVAAAVSIDTREAVADPFRHTAEAVDLLRLRAGQLARDEAGSHRVLRRLRLVTAA